MDVIGKKRILHIDILRILAAFLVVYNHTKGYHFYLDGFDGPVRTGFQAAFSVFTRTNVPLFFMMSGALLLGKEESYKTLFSKRILRFAAVIFCASVVTYVLYNRDSLSLKQFVYALTSGNVTSQYWFLYAYLGFLLALPFMRKLAGQLTQQDILLMVGCRLLLVTLPEVINYITGFLEITVPSLSGYVSLPFAAIDILYYPLLGFYCENRIRTANMGKSMVWLGFVFVCGILGSVFLTCHQGIRTGYTQDYVDTFASVTAPALYLMVKYALSQIREDRISTKFAKAIGTAGTLMLGVYLMDPLFHHFLYNRTYHVVANLVRPIPFSLAYSVVSMTVCATVTYLMKKLPVIRSIL